MERCTTEQGVIMYLISCYQQAFRPITTNMTNNNMTIRNTNKTIKQKVKIRGLWFSLNIEHALTTTNPIFISVLIKIG